MPCALGQRAERAERSGSVGERFREVADIAVELRELFLRGWLVELVGELRCHTQRGAGQCFGERLVDLRADRIGALACDLRSQGVLLSLL